MKCGKRFPRIFCTLVHFFLVCRGRALTLIIFEGGEGVGKTTQLEKLYHHLKSHNFAVLKTREPGGTPLAEKIRSLFKEKTDNPPEPLTELYLLSAARNDHVKNVLLPAQHKKQIVLCDRFLDSTYVYQSILGGLAKEVVDQVSKPVLHGIMPDIVFVFYCDESVAKKRMQKESQRINDRYDSSHQDLHAKILNGYREIYHKQYAYPSGEVPQRVLIDASRDINQIYEEILEKTQKIL